MDRIWRPRQGSDRPEAERAFQRARELLSSLFAKPSNLQAAVRSRALLSRVEYLYNRNPESLTKEVIEDAFRYQYNARPEVLRFLVEKKRVSRREITLLLARQLVDAIPVLQSEPARSWESAKVMANLVKLVYTFPGCLTDKTLACPLSMALFSTIFPRDLLVSMLQCLPSKREFSAFTLGSYSHLPLHLPLRQQIRTSLSDPRSMEAFDVILKKTDTIYIRRKELTRAEVTEMLPMLFRGTNFTRYLHIETFGIQAATGPNDGSLKEMVDPAKRLLEESGGNSRIQVFSISYNHPQHEPDFSPIQSLLVHMKNLQCLHIFVQPPWKVSQELCESLCGLVKQGRLLDLMVQGETAEAGLLLPLIDAVGKSNTMAYLRLEYLRNQTEVDMYQDEMLTILGRNTRFRLVLISKDAVTIDAFSLLFPELKRRINKTWFLDRTRGNDKQRLIDYTTMLNFCGRGKAKSAQLEDFVEVVSAEAIGRGIGFLKFTGDAKQTMITNLQFGLLRLQPSTWLPVASHSSHGRTLDLNSARKRKATGSPEA
ncbi:expressed unknown protein [Seminavis robusta]|uniref:Uncharacterized protein n=1 Tax=Seminavis robusta TaxID=568900 RepID=A0A9N8HBV3_9STRA|nr:expressed unknown protein [Seminavis robusta]|eukprot:Sro197_g083730.1 n/a (541) ;mRNA; r:22163-23785